MIVLDVTELLNNPVRTGIQRVVRELLRHWPAEIPMRVGRYDAGKGLVGVPDAVIELVTDNVATVVNLQADKIALQVASMLETVTPELPTVRRVFVPEVFFDTHRCAFYQASLNADPASVGFVAYDFIPWLYPDRIGVAQSAPLMPYLRLLRTSHRLAFISAATRDDYARRIMRGGGVDGPVLALGCDGLGLARQVFTPDRTGFLCIGSIDGRKNQDRVLKAFQILWMQGHNIPLTIVGDAFPQVDVSAYEATRVHPLFTWHRYATDEAVRALLRTARGTIYVSELEGYGIPPVESLHAGLPVICAASLPSLADLPPAGQLRLEEITPEAIAEAVLMLSDDTTGAQLWNEARRLMLITWNVFGRQAANWMLSA